MCMQRAPCTVKPPADLKGAPSVCYICNLCRTIHTLWTDPSHVTMIIESIYSIPCITVLSLTLTCPSSILLLFLEMKMSLVTAFGLAIFSVNVNGCFWFVPQIYCYALEERAEIIFSIAKWCLLTENFYSKIYRVFKWPYKMQVCIHLWIILLLPKSNNEWSVESV